MANAYHEDSCSAPHCLSHQKFTMTIFDQVSKSLQLLNFQCNSISNGHMLDVPDFFYFNIKIIDEKYTAVYGIEFTCSNIH